jgi:putative ABC transport system ATP-binding protein
MIALVDVEKQYAQGKWALKGVDLHIKEGELVILRGVSGSGKSTLLSLIAALSKPTRGEVIVDKTPLSMLPDHFASAFRLENIGFIFQRYHLMKSLSVAENILLPLIPLNLKPQEVQNRLDEVMKKFHIEHKKDQKVQMLSGGEQQRVAIARAHVNNPKIILADEPTANLDEALSRDFLQILQLLKEEKKTVVIATHDPLFFDLDIVDRYIDVKDAQVFG